MLISCAYLVWYMIRENKQPVEVIETPELTEEQMFIIEQKMQRDNLFCANWWKMNGRFNTSHYVKYLEYREVNG